MSIIGCVLHTRYQLIAMQGVEAGEIVTRRLEHANGEAKAGTNNLGVMLRLTNTCDCTSSVNLKQGNVGRQRAACAP